MSFSDNRDLEIEDAYFDDVGQQLPINPQINNALNYYGFTDTDMVSYAHITGGAKNFIKFAVQNRIPGLSITSMVEKKYIDLYKQLLKEQNKQIQKKNKSTNTKANNSTQDQKNSYEKKIKNVVKQSTNNNSTSSVTDTVNSKVHSAVSLNSQKSSSTTSTVSNIVKPNQQVKESTVVKSSETVAPKVSAKSQASINADLNNPFAAAEPVSQSEQNIVKSDLDKSVVSHKNTKTVTSSVNSMSDSNVKSSLTENVTQSDNINVNNSDSESDPEILNLALNSKKFKSKFDITNFFDKLPETLSIGPIKTNHKLNVNNKVETRLRWNKKMPQMAMQILDQLIENALATTLLAQLSYGDILESYMMYSAAAMGMMNRYYFQQWALAKAMQRIFNNKTSIKRFDKFDDIHLAIQDTHKRTKLPDAVRWFLLLSTVAPKTGNNGSDDWLSKRFKELGNRMDLLTALGISSLSLEDKNDWLNILIGTDAKQFRSLVNEYQQELVKPLQTMRQTKINRARFNREKY